MELGGRLWPVPQPGLPGPDLVPRLQLGHGHHNLLAVGVAAGHRFDQVILRHDRRLDVSLQADRGSPLRQALHINGLEHLGLPIGTRVQV